GEFLYGGGLNTPYPPLWAVLHAGFSLLPAGLAFGLFTLLGIAALWTILVTANRLTCTHLPLSGRRLFWLNVIVLIVARPFILRDLQDGGPNLILTALTWGSISLWIRKADCLAGMCLGLASALKCTPVLFLAYFVWKRQWRVAGTTVAATITFSLVPVLWQG